MNASEPLHPETSAALEPRPSSAESGKIGVAILMWLLGVPGVLILAYLLFAH